MEAARQSVQGSLACPHCGQVERVQHVPAVYRNGLGMYQGSSAAIGVAGGHVAYANAVHGGVTISSIASALSPAPAPRKAGWLLGASLFFIPPFVLMVWIALNMTRHGSPTAVTAAQKSGYAFGTWLIPVFFLLPVVLFLAAFIRRVRRNSLVLRGQHAALAVWNQAWYCDRCGGAFFPAGTPGPVPTGRLLHLGVFRYVVWSAGGYAHAS
jgi:hypothetical protein